MKVIVAGGGWAGCAAALQARKMGAEVCLVERTDMLLGTGLVGGIMRNNGRFTATEELLAMGGGEIFEAVDRNYLHENVEFPGHRHASLYNVATMEPIIRRRLQSAGVTLRMECRLTEVKRDDRRILSVSGKQKVSREVFEMAADAFVDATGTAGPPAQCNKYGTGCAMCVLRCHTFGGRVSLAAKAGVQEMAGRKGGQIGAMSGSCKLLKESLAPSLRETLERDGVAVVPIPGDLQTAGKLSMKACQQYAIEAFAENLVLLDTGHAKLMTPFFSLEALRRVTGFENARYEDPYGGGLGNSIRYIGMAPRDDSLQVEGVENLFCGGEKAGLLVGHTEAICTGTLAGYNAVLRIRREPPLIVPDTLAIGDAIAFVRRRMRTEDGLGEKYTFSGSVYFDRMRRRNLYQTDRRSVAERVGRAGLEGVFSRTAG
ncbi:MAG: FAD-dependent oxidoreductase [Desulfobacteraceae bacterium]|nr:FAD-dependent oxidoreductase [Desulfobacteraceae bacterium]